MIMDENFDEEYVLVYEFQISFNEFKELADESNNTELEEGLQCFNNKDIKFPINTLLFDNGIYSYNKYQVKEPKGMFDNVLTGNTPDSYVIVMVYVHKNFEISALAIINDQIDFEESDELKNYVPIEDEE